MQHTSDDFGEKLEKTAGAVGRQVISAVGSLINDLKQVPPKEQDQIKDDDKKNLADIRKNIQGIDSQFMEAFRKRTQVQKQEEQKKDQQKIVKKEEKTKKDAMWKQQIKVQQGSKELKSGVN